MTRAARRRQGTPKRHRQRWPGSASGAVSWVSSQTRRRWWSSYHQHQRAQTLRTGNGRNSTGGRGRVATTSGVTQKPPNARPCQQPAVRPDRSPANALTRERAHPRTPKRARPPANALTRERQSQATSVRPQNHPYRPTTITMPIRPRGSDSDWNTPIPMTSIEFRMASFGTSS